MVASSSKFLCGVGCITLYYCKVCGEPHVSRAAASRCEKSHTRLGKTGRMKALALDYKT